MKCPTRLFADDTKIYNSIRGQISHCELQDDLDALLRWSEKWQLPFNIGKCKMLHLGQGNPQHQYQLQDSRIASVAEEKDLGVFVDEQLKFRKQAATAISKGNRVLGLIRRSFENLDRETLPLLFKTLVRPLLEYGNAVWGPFNRQDQYLVERVQRRATRMIPALRHLAYQDRLRQLRLPSLCYRRRRGDLILMYALLKGRLNIKKDDFFQDPPLATTRGHSMKVAKPSAQVRARRHHWSIRVVNDWNSLPDHVVLAQSPNEFKNLLDDHLSDHLYDT